MPRKKLLIVTTVPDTLAFILKGLPRFLNNHYTVHLATSQTKDTSFVAEQENINPHIVNMARRISPVTDLLSVLTMIKLLRTLRPYILHSYTPKAGLVSMLAGWICRVPIRIHTFTGLIFPSSTGLARQILVLADQLICLCATHVIPEGQGVKDDLRRYHVTNKPLNVLGFGNIAGVDTSVFSRTAPGLPQKATQLHWVLKLDQRDFVFCYVGRIHKDKGIRELAQAFEVLPHNTRLIIVGPLDATAPIDRGTLSLLQNHTRVHMLGFLHDVRPALLCSHVLVLPSYREGFPNTVLQAGAMQLPVIATDISGCNEIIEPGVNGWLVPPRDLDSLEKAMREAMNLPEIGLKELGKRARRRIQFRFEQREHRQRLLEFYREATRSARRT